jgi:branched-chain amino acid transport system permease protein
MHWKAITFDKRTIAIVAVVVAALAIFPSLSFQMADYVLSVMTQALLFVYLANSWNIISGLTGMFSMGHAAFFGAGAYACAIMTVQVDMPGVDIVTKYIWGVIIGIIVSALLGALVAYIATKLKGLFFAMTTLAMAEILRTFALQSSITNGNIGIIIPPSLSPGAKTSYYIILCMCVIAFLFTWYLKHCRFGRMFIAIRENENLAASLGVNISKWTYVSVIISAVLAALGGAYYPLYLSHIEPTSTFDYSITMQMMIVCIAGGRGSVLGPMVGGVVILLNEIIRSVLTKLSSGATSYAVIAGVLYGIVLLMIVLFLSGGLISIPSKFGAWKAKRSAVRRGPA